MESFFSFNKNGETLISSVSIKVFIAFWDCAVLVLSKCICSSVQFSSAALMDNHNGMRNDQPFHLATL